MLSATTVPFVETGAYETTHILVGFDQQALASGQPITALAGTKIGNAVAPELGLYSVELDFGMSVEAAVAAYSADPSVAYAQPDYEIHVELDPNDPYFQNGSLWGMEIIQAPQAWDTTTGSNQIVVAVIDTGIDYTHSDLATNIWRNTDEIAGNGFDDDGNGYIDDNLGWDFANNDRDPMDDHSHGTHVAGTIGAVGNNSNGVVGVNWNVQLMPLKFLAANGSGSTSAAIGAINYARANGADIINASWGGGGYSAALNYAINAFSTGGGIFVAAAGNSANNNDNNAFYPANYPDVIAVAASTSTDALASFSNYGVNTVEIAAPGAGIVSTVPGNRYATFSGTSMASPHVAGAMALVWSVDPGLTRTQVINAVLDTADPILLNRVTKGRLNLAAAVESVGGGTPPGGGYPSPPGGPGGPGPIPEEGDHGPRIIQATWAAVQYGTLGVIHVTFDEPVNPATFDASDVILTGPGGLIGSVSVTVVPGTNNTKFDVAFPAQSAAGTYSVQIGPDITDTAGNQMDQDGDPINGEIPDDIYFGQTTLNSKQTFTWTGNAPILDFTTTQILLPIAPSLIIDDLDVLVKVNHTWDSDLIIQVTNPFGRSQWLFYRRGGSGDNVYATFDDEATTPIYAGSAPFNGSYRPDGILATNDGSSTQGIWRLSVMDVAAGDQGQILEFSLIVTPRAGAASFEPPGDDSGTSPAATSGNTPIVLLDFDRDETPATDAAPHLVGLASPQVSAVSMTVARTNPSVLAARWDDEFAVAEDEESDAADLAATYEPDLDAVFGDFDATLQGELLML